MRKQVGICLSALAAIVLVGMSDAKAGAYVGAAIGQGSTQVESNGVTTFDASDTAFKLQGGYRFQKHFGVEADYRDLGTAEDNSSGTNMQTDASSFDVFAVGVLPVGKGGNWELFGKMGVAAWQADVAAVGIPNSQVSDDGTDLALGVGVGYAMKKVTFRMEYEQFDTVDNGSEDMISAGFDWRF